MLSALPLLPKSLKISASISERISLVVFSCRIDCRSTFWVAIKSNAASNPNTVFNFLGLAVNVKSVTLVVIDGTFSTGLVSKSNL